MLKKYFDWTPSDIQKWEELRAKGLAYFIGWFGLKLFAGWVFLLVGAGILFFWVRGWLQNGSANPGLLALELLAAAVVCVLGGLIAAVATWALEESIYRKIRKEQVEGRSHKG